MAGWPRFRPVAPSYHSEYLPMGLTPNFPVRPAPARSPVVKRPMPAGNMNTSMDVKRMRTTSAVMPAVTPASTVSASSSMQSQPQNAISLINQYKPGLVYEIIGEQGPSHSKTFTVELTVDEQVFRATGESKAAARINVAQKAVDVLGPKIEAELECRKFQKE